jgi:hypothetical protein
MCLVRPGDEFDGEMLDRVDMRSFLMAPCYVGAQFESLWLPGHRTKLRDLPASPDLGLLDTGCRLANALRHGLSGNELYCEILIEAMLTRILIRHATMTSGRIRYREILTPAKLRALVALRLQLRLGDLAAAAALSRAHLHGRSATLRASLCTVTSCIVGLNVHGPCCPRPVRGPRPSLLPMRRILARPIEKRAASRPTKQAS